MSEQNLSQWFLLSEQKPWEVGVYELKYSERMRIEEAWGWFDGDKWHGGWPTKQKALDSKNKRSIDLMATHWRGLSTKQQGEV